MFYILKVTILFYIFESFEKKRDVIENRPSLLDECV